MEWFKKFKRSFSKITGISTPIFGLQWERQKNVETSGQAGSATEFPDGLIDYFWKYPTGDANQASWAVKESAVLRGRLEAARQDPGLGVAIVTTELALDAFGEEAWNRVQETCIRWAIARTEETTPHFVKVEVLDPITSRRELKPDFRHTVALAVILARTKSQYAYLKGYLNAVLGSQRNDGGWAPGSGTTISEVITVLYAAELLHLCADDHKLEQKTRSDCESSRDRALAWLLANRSTQGLWSSGVLTEYPWDDLLTTAWVVHRLAPLHQVYRPMWVAGLRLALHNMVRRTMDPGFWTTNDVLQRNRVEARIAAATSKAKKLIELDEQERGLADLYLSGWKTQASAWVKSTQDAALDVGTVAFLLQGLLDEFELVERARIISAQAPVAEVS